MPIFIGAGALELLLQLKERIILYEKSSKIYSLQDGTNKKGKTVNGSSMVMLNQYLYKERERETIIQCLGAVEKNT